MPDKVFRCSTGIPMVNFHFLFVLSKMSLSMDFVSLCRTHRNPHICHPYPIHVAFQNAKWKFAKRNSQDSVESLCKKDGERLRDGEGKRQGKRKWMRDRTVTDDRRSMHNSIYGCHYAPRTHMCSGRPNHMQKLSELQSRAPSASTRNTVDCRRVQLHFPVSRLLNFPSMLHARP